MGQTGKGTARERLRERALRAGVAGEMRAKEWLGGGGDGDSEEGSTTVEYAIGAVATAAFAGLLLAVLKSGGVKAMLNNIIQTALTM